MPEHWIKFMSSEAGGGLAILIGAIIRGLAGPGPWMWREFFVSVLAGLSFAAWVAPWIVDQMDWGEKAYGMVCLGFGMTALPISRGVIKMARGFRENPNGFFGR